MESNTTINQRLKEFGTPGGLKFVKKYGIMISFLFITIIISIITPNFLSTRNIMNILRQSSLVGIMAIGTTFVIIGGDIDISVGSTLALAAAVVLKLQTSIHWGWAICIALGVGLIIGLINGLLRAKIKIVAIIATLGTMVIVRGIVFVYTGGYPITGASEAFKFIGSGYLFGIPFPVILLIILVLFWQFVLSKTKFGRYSCAIGGNKEAARLSGVPVDFYHTMTFTIGGLMAAMAGVVYASRLTSVIPKAGDGMELEAIAATVIGGTSISGGEGSVVGTLVGVLLLTVIYNVFNILGVQTYVQLIARGVIILTVVGIDSYSKFGKKQ